MVDNEFMSLEKAMFILRHGSAEGEHKYFEAIDVIEKEINRQKVEIKNLKSDYIKTLTKQIELCDTILHQKTEIERLKYILAYEERKYDKCAKRFYKEGIKEFAERYKALLETELAWCECVDDITKPLDNLVKEMVGDSDV